MAVPKVEVDLMWDNTALKQGTIEAEADINRLADAVDSASADMQSSLSTVATTADAELGTALPQAADNAAVGLTTKASKFKAVGTELGQTLAQGVGSGLSGPEAAANLGTSVSGLLAPLAATGAGAVAAIGLGLGGALIGNMIKAANDRREEFVDAVVAGFQEIEVKAKSTFASIREDALATYDLKDLISELEKMGVSADELRATSESLGKPWFELAQVLRGDITPSNRDTLEALRGQSKELDYQTKASGVVRDVYTDQARTSQTLVGLSDKNRDLLRDRVDLALLERDAVEGTARATERAADAGERLGAAYGNAVRQAGLLDLALGG